MPISKEQFIENGYLNIWEFVEKPQNIPIPNDLIIEMTYSKIEVFSDELVDVGGILDMQIVYSTVFLRKIDQFLAIGSQIEVIDFWSRYHSNYGLPSGEHVSVYVPVYIDKNGYGFIELRTNNPAKIEVNISEVIPNMLFPLHSIYE